MLPGLGSIKIRFAISQKFSRKQILLKWWLLLKLFTKKTKKCHRRNYSSWKKEQTVQRTFWSKVGFSRKCVKNEIFLFSPIFEKIVQGSLKKVPYIYAYGYKHHRRHSDSFRRFHLRPWVKVEHFSPCMDSRLNFKNVGHSPLYVKGNTAWDSFLVVLLHLG